MQNKTEIQPTISTPLISVVLATKGDRTDLLEKCIKSLENQVFKNFEIILVYGIYPEKLTELIKQDHIILIRETGEPLAAARNLGVKNANGQIVSFIDDDAVAPDDWLKKVASIFNEGKLDCLGGPHLTPPEESKKSPLSYVAGESSEVLAGHAIRTGPSAVGKIAGCNVSYRKDAFNELCGLNEALRSGEDWDLNMRLCENGFSIRFDPNVWVWHHRQGLKHTFVNISKMVPFFLSKRTMNYAKYESFFASFYILNALFLVMLVLLFSFPFIFIFIFSFAVLFHFVFTVIRSPVAGRSIAYYPLTLVFSFVRIAGFYFGLFKEIRAKIISYFKYFRGFKNEKRVT
jgi:glycosyltransferase involved in cell wall biosynthesis